MLNPVDLDSLEIRLIAVAPSSDNEASISTSTAKTVSSFAPTTPSDSTVKTHPWGIQASERKPMIRFSVDLDLDLSDRLAAKARELRKPKIEVVRQLLEWALSAD